MTTLTYSEAFVLPHNAATTVKVLAARAERWWTPAEAEAAFVTSSVPAETPVISPDAGEYSNGQQITIECATALADVRYTLDGTVPDADSYLYSGPFLLPYNATTVVKARAMESPDGFWTASETASSEFETVVGPAWTPYILPCGAGGDWDEYNYENSDMEFSILAQSGVDTYYTTDGTDVTSESPVYSGPFTLPDNSFHEIQALTGADPGGAWTESAVNTDYVTMSTMFDVPAPDSSYAWGNLFPLPDAKAILFKSFEDDDGDIEVMAAIVATSGDTGEEITIGDFQTITATGLGNPTLCQMSDTKILAIASDYNNPTELGYDTYYPQYAYLITITDGVITAGTPTLFTGYWDPGRVVKLTETMAICPISRYDGLWQYRVLALHTISISGSTITFSESEAEVGAWQADLGYICGLTDTTALMVHFDPTPFVKVGRVLTVTGDAISIGTGYATVPNFSIASGYTGDVHLAKLTSTTAIFIYYGRTSASDNYSLNAIVFEIAGTVVSNGDILQWGEPLVASTFTFALLSESRAIFTNKDFIGEYPYNMSVGCDISVGAMNISGTDISISDFTRVGGANVATAYRYACQLSDYRALLTYREPAYFTNPGDAGGCLKVLSCPFQYSPAASGDDGHGITAGTVFDAAGDSVQIGGDVSVETYDLSMLAISYPTSFNVTNIEFYDGGGWERQFSWDVYESLGTWSVDHWESFDTGDGHGIALVVSGDWATDYRPTKIRVTHNCGGDAELAVVNTEVGTAGSSKTYTSEDEVDLTYTDGGDPPIPL